MLFDVGVSRCILYSIVGYLLAHLSLRLIGEALKGTATLMISMFYMKELYEPWILIPVSSKSVEKYGSYGSLNICKWTLMEAAFL